MFNDLGLSDQKLSVRFSTLVHIPERVFGREGAFRVRDCQAAIVLAQQVPPFGPLARRLCLVYPGISH